MTFATLQNDLFQPDTLVVLGVLWIYSLLKDGGKNRRKYRRWDKIRKKQRLDKWTKK